MIIIINPVKSNINISMINNHLYKQKSSTNHYTLYYSLAILQSLTWLFILPEICRPIWPTIFSKISSPILKEVLLNQTVTIIFILYGLCIVPIYYIQHPFFEQFKIIKNKSWPWLDPKIQIRHEFWQRTRKSMKLASFNLIILVPCATILKTILMDQYLNMPHLSYDNNDQLWPTIPRLIRDNLLLTLLHEFLFHTTHRIMHIYPALYKYHKVHHEYKQNVFYAAQHNHPIDYIISIATPVVLSLYIVNPKHSFTQFQWAIYVIYANLDDHVGYAFPFSPVRWFYFAARTEEHEFHHGVNVGCFSSKLDLFERIFGTNEKFYKWWDNMMEMNCSDRGIDNYRSTDSTKKIL